MTSPAKPRRGRWRRAAIKLLIIVAGLAIILPALVLVGLQTPAVRGWILAGVANTVEERAGLQLTARDFRLRLLSGVIEIEELTLAAAKPGGSPPFLTVSRARAGVRWRTLLGDRPIIDSLSVEGPRLDLGVPLPQPAGDAEPRDSAAPPIEIFEFELTDGRVIGARAPESMEIWLDALRVEDARARGEFRAGRLVIDDFSARLIAGSHRRESVELRVSASGHGDLGSGSFDVDSLQVSGEGLNLEAQGRFEIAAASATGGEQEIQAAVLSFDLHLEPPRLFPDLTSSGRLHGNGELQLERSPDLTLRGSTRIVAADLPAELASPWLDGIDVRGPLDPSGTRLDASADVELAIALVRGDGPDPDDRVIGDAELTWRRDAEPLLTASVRSVAPAEGTPADAGGVHLSIAGELTPEAAGQRQISGELWAPSWLDLLDGTLHAARIDLDEPDLERAVQRFGLDASALPSWWPQGGVSASLDADGPLIAPRLRLDARWIHDDETLATLSAHTLGGVALSPGEGAASPALHVGVDASLLPEAAGRRELTGELLAPGWHRITEAEFRNVRLVVELDDLAETDRELARRLPNLLAQGLVPDQVPTDLLRSRLSARVDATGPLTALDLRADADWAAGDDESARLTVRGRTLARPPYVESGSAAELDIRNLDLSRLEIPGRIERLRLDVTTDGRAVEVRELSAKLRVGDAENPIGGELLASGRFDLAWPPERGEMRIAIDRPYQGIDRVETVLRLEQGVLRAERARVSSAGQVASLQAAAPLGTLAKIVPGLELLAVSPAHGPIRVEFTNVDLSTLTRFVDAESALPALYGTLDGAFSFDPLDPVATVGWLTLDGGGVDMPGDRFEVGRAVRMEIADARFVFPRTKLQPTGGLIRGGVPLELAALVELAPDWKPGDELTALIDRFEIDLDGTVDASLLNPFLAGGAARGEVALSIRAEGSLEDLGATVRIRGPNAAVFYRQPYPTRLEGLEADLIVQGREVRLERARARINGGDAEMTGSFTPDEGLNGNVKLDGAHYRLEFGIATRVSADVDVEWPLEGRKRVAGRLVVERAVLRRPIRLSGETLQVLFEAGEERGANPVLEKIDLDLDVLTDEGVRINNNVADLHADWSRLHVGGTAADPRLDGRVDVRPGGIVTALGVVYRIDEASLEWAGEPAGEPRWTLEWTSSLDDPTIIQGWRNEFFSPADLGPGRGGTLDFWGQGQGTVGTEGVWQTVATGVATQATSASRTQLTFEPLPLFGETDTQARYTLSQELSPQLTFIASTNPREAESQTYILDMHQLPVLPTFRAQLFTNDRKNAGLTVQQTMRLGARPPSDLQDPQLRSTTIDAPEGVGKRRLRRAIGFRRSDPFPDGAALDVEVDVVDALRRRGYASAEVGVGLEPTGRNGVDLLVSVDPGNRVSFIFEGDEIPSRLRRTINSAYRPAELGQELSLAEVQRETAQALRGLGYLEPQVAVDSAPADPADPEGARVIRVVADGGRRVGLSKLVVEGLPDDDARRVVEVFGTTLSRVELVLESPAGDVVLSRALQRRGYPQARIAERELSDDGETLVLRVDPGGRRQVVSIEIEGLNENDRLRILESLELHVGDPARSDLIGQEARTIERDLRDRGHADARVRARTRQVAEDRPLDTALVYEVDPGPSYRIEELRFEGLGASREKWVEGIAGLESGETFRQRDVAEARARLYRTGVFQRIRVSSQKRAEDQDETAKAPALVTFELEEQRRWRLAYGGRWEDERGISVVVDLLNTHSLGRGHMTGVRAIYGGHDQNLRLYHIIPRIVGEKSSLELLVEGKREDVSSTLRLKSTEAWAQLTFPLTRRIANRPYVRFQDPELTSTDPESDEPLDQRVISPLLGWQFAFDAQRRRAGEQRRRGMFVGIDLLGSHTALGSDVTSIGVVSQLKYFMPVGKLAGGRLTWAQFWRGGWTEAKDEPVPLVDRFRVGGEFSVRGYPTNSLGPLGPDGIPLGGELLFIVNQELHADLVRMERLGTISGLVFFDAGNVWLDRSTLDTGLFKSVGIGARYGSPFGPFRLDLAFPLDRRPDDPSSKLYFGFGSVF